MSKYKPLYSNIWNDPDFENFSIEKKLVFIFLITNSAVEKSGIYKITIKQISFYTDVQKNIINEIINELINANKIKYDFENGIIFIKNIFKFQKGMIKNKKIMFISLLKNYHMVKTEFWQDFFNQYANDEIINEFINENINKEIKDLIINKKPKKTKTPKSPKFTPPTLQQVKDYCQERANNVNPEQFIDHYKANGWKVGKNPMKDWKASVRTWERNNKNTTTTTQEDYYNSLINKY